MNTPASRKRYTPPRIEPDGLDVPGGTYVSALLNTEVAAALGQLVVDFEHTEDLMSYVLSDLLGNDDSLLSGYILRAIRAPRGRFDLMKELLTLAPHNRTLGDEYDEILRSFDDLRRARNRYVHGRWFSKEDDHIVVFSDRNEHGTSILGSRLIEVAELEQVLKQLADLRQKILRNFFSRNHPIDGEISDPNEG